MFCLKKISVDILILKEVNELKTKLVKVKEENTELQKELDVTRSVLP